MIISISDKIRKLANFIEEDNTPSDAEIGDRSMLDESTNEEPIKKKKKKPVKVEESKITPTAPPEQRRPRKQPAHLNKWNEDTKTENMREYMEGYRSDGKDKEVDGPKSTYKKKFKSPK